MRGAVAPVFPPTRFPDASGWGKNIQRTMRLTGNGNALTAPGGNPRLQVRSGFNQLEPRKISFTTTLSFESRVHAVGRDRRRRFENRIVTS